MSETQRETQVVGLDNGNAFTKIVTGYKSTLIFPSVVAPIGNIVKVGGYKFDPSYADDTGQYLVGDQAIRYSNNLPGPALDSMRYESDEYRITGMHALRKAGVRRANIVCGLPIGHIKTHRETVVRAIMGWSKHDNTIHIDRVQVLHEPAGAYFDVVLDWNGVITNHLQEAVVGIIDVGGHTIDIAEVRYGKPVIQHHVCVSEGIIHAYRPMLNDLLQRFKDAPFTVHDMPKIMRDGTVEVHGKKHSVKELTRKVVKNLSNSVFSGIKKMWPSGTGLLRLIILTGGPAELIQDELQKKMETPVEVPQDPAFANARGFYKFAVMTSQT